MDELATILVIIAIFVIVSLYGRWRMYQRATHCDGPAR